MFFVVEINNMEYRNKIRLLKIGVVISVFEIVKCILPKFLIFFK